MKLIMESWRKYSKGLIKEKLGPGFGLKGSGGLRSKAILDMLSAFAQPKGDKAERLLPSQDHLLTQAEIPGTYFKQRLLRGPDYTTSETDYRSYAGVDNNPVSVEQMSKDLKMPPENLMGKYDFFDYILRSMVNMGLVRVSPTNAHPTSHEAKYKLRPAGAKMFKREFDAEKQIYGDPFKGDGGPGRTQLGRAQTTKGEREPSDAQLGIKRGRKFDPARYTEE